MMKPSYILGEAGVPSSKFKSVLGDHIPREELKRLKASLEAMDLSPDHHDIYYDYQDHYYDGFGGDFNKILTEADRSRIVFRMIKKLKLSENDCIWPTFSAEHERGACVRP